MSNKAKTLSEENGKKYLKNCLVDVEKAFVQKLIVNTRAVTHSGSLGDANEDAWIDLLRDYLPSRYQVAKAFAIDHTGKTTDQTDCLIYDAHFTPALFGTKGSLYVPVEAVHAALEIKPTVNSQNLKYAGKKVASLRRLTRTSAVLSGPYSSKYPKPLFPIIGGILALNVEWKNGLDTTFFTNFNDLTDDEKLDFVLTGQGGFCDHFDHESDPQVFSGDGSLIRGLFRLLNALRLQNTVPAIEWDKYEQVLDETE